MYRCNICRHVSRPGDKLRRHVIKRTVGANPFLPPLDGNAREEIEREVPVCGACARDLEKGATLAQLTREAHSRSQTVVQAAIPPSVVASPLVINPVF